MMKTIPTFFFYWENVFNEKVLELWVVESFWLKYDFFIGILVYTWEVWKGRLLTERDFEIW